MRLYNDIKVELIVRMKNGLLFQVGDANDLYEKMKLLIENPRLIKTHKGKAEEVKTLEENAEELEAIYSQLVGTDERGIKL